MRAWHPERVDVVELSQQEVHDEIIGSFQAQLLGRQLSRFRAHAYMVNELLILKYAGNTV